MAKVCEACGKKPQVGHSVSHSNRKTKRRFLPNLFKKRLLTQDLKHTVFVRVCTKCLRTLTKYAEFHGMNINALYAIQKKRLK